jgi:hypothetical protein
MIRENPIPIMLPTPSPVKPARRPRDSRSTQAKGPPVKKTPITKKHPKKTPITKKPPKKKHRDEAPEEEHRDEAPEEEHRDDEAPEEEHRDEPPKKSTATKLPKKSTATKPPKKSTATKPPKKSKATKPPKKSTATIVPRTPENTKSPSTPQGYGGSQGVGRLARELFPDSGAEGEGSEAETVEYEEQGQPAQQFSLEDVLAVARSVTPAPVCKKKKKEEEEGEVGDVVQPASDDAAPGLADAVQEPQQVRDEATLLANAVAPVQFVLTVI